ncbi:hypothetical protein [Thermococcus sp.]|uniref:hypothetical protein n=1 Tax=Thermococcus sp. TaxID=35749 RepID=UPI00261FFF07|nr:hypothetical protein [Thermococcus sp.]
MKWKFEVEGENKGQILEDVSVKLMNALNEREKLKKELEELHVEALELSNRILLHQKVSKMVRLVARKLNRSYTTRLDLPLDEGKADGCCYRIEFIGAGSLAIFEFRFEDLYSFFKNLHKVREEAEGVIYRAVEDYISKRDELTGDDEVQLRRLAEEYYLHFTVVLDALESSVKY